MMSIAMLLGLLGLFVLAILGIRVIASLLQGLLGRREDGTGGLSMGHVTLACPHCHQQTRAGLPACEHCGVEL